MVKGLLVEVVYNQHLKYKGYVEDVDDKCIYIRISLATVIMNLS